MTAALQSPVRYDPSVERIEPNEGKTVEQLIEAFDEILETTAADSGHAIRSVHAKAHGIIGGTLTVPDNLPAELAQGLFATPGTHKVLLRISTNPGDILDDSITVPRGYSIKVLDVEGDRLPDADGSTQDLIMVNGQVFVAPTPEKFLGNLKLLAKTTDRAEWAKKALSAFLRGTEAVIEAVGGESGAVKSLGGAPSVHPLGETYYSQTPFRYGNYIAKFSLVPVSPDLTALEGQKVDYAGRPDAIREDVRASMADISAQWEMRVQLCRDLETMPIEDASVEWKEEQSPFQTVATLTATPQDSWDAAQVKAVEDGMRFSVWTGLAAHQPLGAVNRARRDTYRHSAEFRERYNGCPIHEPSAREPA